jgi:dihydrofolate reductase
MHISLIWAMSTNGVIGRGQRLPWRLPKEMQFFVRTTLGKPVIMGRKTFESMKAPLPGRTNIVVTRDEDYQREGIKVANDLAGALVQAEAQCLVDGRDEIMVAGGAQIYALALPIATRLYVTTVDADIQGDTFFPELDLDGWQELSQESFAADAANSHAYSIAIYERLVQAPIGTG